MINAPNQPPRLPILALIFVPLLTIFLIYYYNYIPARANEMTYHTMGIITHHPTHALESIKNLFSSPVVQQSPHIDDIRTNIAQSLSNNLTRQPSPFNNADRQQLFGIGYQMLKKNIALHPHDVRPYLALANYGQIGASLSQNPAYLTEAIDYLERALRLSPNRQQLLYNLGSLHTQLGHFSEAEALIRQALIADPAISESYWRLADIYKRAGETKKARAILALAHRQGLVFSAAGEAVEARLIGTNTAR